LFFVVKALYWKKETFKLWVARMTDQTKAQEYRVLARKYRPQNFAELKGQEALVRTLTNAIESGRIAHAFMLTGVRGVGKTTTARLIARALNYTGPDGNSGPTTGATDDCETALSIAADRHPDVIEMDAASRTGVDDIREILDGVRYAPVSARYKIYIIDEVHMLSKQAFNALLKTLEEPPAHVKFIMATTEIRKVPVTVLSRCQRFDLRRVEVDVLKGHFENICKEEGFEAEDEALTLIARAADGSVRDGLSLLDQAMTMSASNVEGDKAPSILSEGVSGMLGLSDRVRILDLFEACMKGQAPEALSIMDDLHKLGADPQATMQDLLDMTHAVSVIRVLGEKGGNAKALSSDEDLSIALPHSALKRAKELASGLALPALDRAWNILTKGIQEINRSGDARKSLEMALLRLIYAGDLPDPAKLIKKLLAAGDGAGGMAAGAAIQAPAPSGGGAGQTVQHLQAVSTAGANVGAIATPQMQPYPEGQMEKMPAPTSLTQIIALCEARGEMMLGSHVHNYVHVVKLKPGRLEFRADPAAPQNLAQRLTQILNDGTDTRWMVSLSTEAGEKTLAQIDAENKQALEDAVMNNPSVAKIFELFPGARLDAIEKDN
jgi:DNA polymerase-3 subunit gamma/tau